VDHTVGLVPRHAEKLVTEALSDTRVVTLNGARQAGKSTLARLAAQASPHALVRLLDDPATLRAARDDPAGFVDHDGLLVIDKVQLAPELFRSIKVAVDRPTPGTVLAHRIGTGASAAPTPRRTARPDGNRRAVAVLPGRDRSLP